MTIKELIKELQDYDGNLEVMYEGADFLYDINTVTIGSVSTKPTVFLS